jgi:pyruvate dehydrogenase E2 component (dihydrolipoamide acetyltransferase)
VDVVVPVIFPPQVAIVGVGTLTTRPWVVGDACLPRPTLTLSLAADHRVTDGHTGARFLARVADLLVRADL